MPNPLMPTSDAAPVPGAAAAIPQPGAPPPNALAPGGMPQGPAPQGMPQAPVSMAGHAARVVGGLQMTPEQAADRVKKLDYMVGLLTKLARKPELKRDDVVSAGAKAITDRMATPIEVADFLQGLPSGEKGLRAAVQQRLAATLHGAVHLHGMIGGGGG